MPPPADPIIGVRTKIQRANRHIEELDDAIQRFRKADLCEIAANRYPDLEGQQVHAIVVANDPLVPPEIAVVFGEVLFNLRSALDQLAFALCPTAGLPPGTIGNIYFPIADSPAKYVTAGAEVKRLAKPEAVKVLDRVQPYKGGDGEILWVLEQLNNIDKHRLPLTVAFRLDTMDWAPMTAESMRQGGYPEAVIARAIKHLYSSNPIIKFPASTPPLKAGHVLFTTTGELKGHDKVKLAVDVALDEPGIVGCKPLAPLVHEFADFVGGIVPQLERYVI